MAEAEAMYRRALEGYEKAWGPEHPSTLNTVNNLGILCKDQGKMAEAEAMYRRALEGREKAWGPEHTSTLDTVNNLGVLYKDQGMMAEAEAMFRRVRMKNLNELPTSPPTTGRFVTFIYYVLIFFPLP
ncbi:beta transducin-like protein het-e4s [Lasallia pustulata]|uniref:Beta transducin-like protein het-e4s n=1 Tax=Lasallia pustulata TaxID=136370 RepID=A0A1W5D3X3_9LECA|nr:beta transducin-like protein het-e4s [Lasallia pustulata]